MTVKTITIGIGASGLAALLCLGATSDARADESVDAKFQMMDTNGDGKISAEEHAAGSKTMFETMDANRDGKVTVVEMETVQEKMGGKAGGKMKMSAAEKMKVIDVNKDGVITEEEFESGSKSMFDKLDADKDGYVTKAELQAGHDKMMKKSK
jgi:Ca2+-binding EF-hand superfamily protein